MPLCLLYISFPFLLLLLHGVLSEPVLTFPFYTIVNIIFRSLFFIAVRRVKFFPLARRAKGKKRAWVARYGLLGWLDLLLHCAIVFLEADAFYDCALACVVFTYKKNEAQPYMIDVRIEPISFFFTVLSSKSRDYTLWKLADLTVGTLLIFSYEKTK